MDQIHSFHLLREKRDNILCRAEGYKIKLDHCFMRRGRTQNSITIEEYYNYSRRFLYKFVEKISTVIFITLNKDFYSVIPAQKNPVERNNFKQKTSVIPTTDITIDTEKYEKSKSRKYRKRMSKKSIKKRSKHIRSIPDIQFDDCTCKGKGTCDFCDPISYSTS